MMDLLTRSEVHALSPYLSGHERAEIDRLARETLLPFPVWLRREAPAWTWSWEYQRYLYAALEEISQRDNGRLMISLPPRHGKSELVTVRYTAWRLEREPAMPIILGAYNQTLAERFSRKIRRIARERVALSTERKAAEEWETAAGGGVRAAGVGTGITGMGGRLIVIDDPVKSREEANSEAFRERVWDWYRDDLYTRLEPGGSIILIMTRWHEDDLAGRLLREMAAGGEQWRVINLPALAEPGDALGRAVGTALCPARYPAHALRRIERVMGASSFGALYQGRPSPAEGGLFKRWWWRFWYDAEDAAPPPVTVRLADGGVHLCPQVPRPAAFDGMAQSWDCAFKDGKGNDCVAGGVWGWVGAEKYLLAQTCRRMDFPATLQAIRTTCQTWPQSEEILIEDKANGSAVVQVLRRELSGVVAVEPAGGKVARAHAVAPMMEAGQVYLPHPAQASWVRDYLEELAAFPSGTHDDQVDQTTQFLLRRRAWEYQWHAQAPSVDERRRRSGGRRCKDWEGARVRRRGWRRGGRAWGVGRDT